MCYTLKPVTCDCLYNIIRAVGAEWQQLQQHCTEATLWMLTRRLMRSRKAEKAKVRFRNDMTSVLWHQALKILIKWHIDLCRFKCPKLVAKLIAKSKHYNYDVGHCTANSVPWWNVQFSLKVDWDCSHIVSKLKNLFFFLNPFSANLFFSPKGCAKMTKSLKKSLVTALSL